MEDAGLKELKQKLAEEERTYAELLAGLDSLSENPAPFDRDPELPRQLERLNKIWEIHSDTKVPASHGAAGSAKWIRRIIRRFIDPELAPLRESLSRQQSFNSHIVQLLNRYMETTHKRAERLSELASTLVRFSQRIDRLADAKDKLYASLNNTRTDLLLEAMDKRLETMALGLRRAQDRLEGLLSSVDLARTELVSLRNATAGPPKATEPAEPTPRTESTISGPWERAEYVAFENRFRGSSEVVRERLSLYVQYFEGLAPVLELGCGRGEFLDLLRESNIEARGIDDNQEMLSVCRERGLEVEQADITTFMRGMGAESIGGIFAAQVIEHLDPADLRQLLAASHRVLRKGGRLVVETVNPRSLTALVESFYRDLTHQKPLHPETLDFLLRACGFPKVEIEYASPIGERAKLLTITAEDDTGRTLNENFRKLNGFLFGDLDYAAIATK